MAVAEAEIGIVGAEHIQRDPVGTTELTAIGNALLGRTDLTLSRAVFRPVDYEIMTIATDALTRGELTLQAPDGSTHAAKVFIKSLHHPRHWAYLDAIPAEHRELFLRDFPWRLELAALDGRIEAVLPDGFRLPAVYRVAESDDGFAAIWMEDVTEPAVPDWTEQRYRDVAYRLAQLAARRRFETTEPLIDSPVARIPNFGLRMLVEGRLRHFAIPIIQSEEFPQNPTVAAALERIADPTLIDDVRALMTRLDDILDRADRCPLTYAHGDASPTNLLIDAADPDTIVVLDWGFDSPMPVGHDLGQLLIGRCHNGQLDPAELPRLDDVITDGYALGLADEGFVVPPEVLRFGYLSGLVVRSGFTSLLLERLAEPASDELIDAWVARLRLTRAIVELARGVV